MKRSRHQARIAALQGLYQLDVQRAPVGIDVDAVMTEILLESGLGGEGVTYAKQLVVGTWGQRERFDQMIAGVSAHWDISRMAVVDRNILRLALYELIAQPNVPLRVVFDEAIELGKEFGEASTPQFVNGVLDAIRRQDPACRAARGESDRRDDEK